MTKATIALLIFLTVVVACGPADAGIEAVALEQRICPVSSSECCQTSACELISAFRRQFLDRFFLN